MFLLLVKYVSSLKCKFFFFFRIIVCHCKSLLRNEISLTQGGNKCWYFDHDIVNYIKSTFVLLRLKMEERIVREIIDLSPLDDFKDILRIKLGLMGFK